MGLSRGRLRFKKGGGGGDGDITLRETKNTFKVDIAGPITRARARQLNTQVSSFLCNSFNDFEDRLLPNDVIVLRNHREDQGTLEGGLGGGEDPFGRPIQDGSPTHDEFKIDSDSRTSSH